MPWCGALIFPKRALIFPPVLKIVWFVTGVLVCDGRSDGSWSCVYVRMRLLFVKKLGTKNTYRPRIPIFTRILPNASFLPEDVMGMVYPRGFLEKKNPKILIQSKVTKIILRLRRPFS